MEVVDLTNSSAFTLTLLDDTWRWRQRLVEELELRTSDHITVTSSFQMEFPPELVAPHIGNTRPQWIKVLLPLVTRDKRPLLRFDVSGPGRTQAHLIRRSWIAVISAEYLGRLVASSPAGPSIAAGLSPPLLEAICVTTPQIFREFETQSERIDLALARYLSDGLGFDVPPRDAARWNEHMRATGQVLADALTEPYDVDSTSDNVLLALPRLEPRPSTIEEIDDLLERYRAAVRQAREADDLSLLVALADYGRRYELILELEAPLNEPFTVKVAEDRPLDLRRHGWTEQRFGLRDAIGFHFEARSSDHTVEIADFHVRDLQGRQVGIPPLEGGRYTKEFLALYSSDPERPASVIVSLRLRPTRDVRWTAWFVALLGWAAALTAIGVPARRNLVEVLSLLTVPTTFAVALVLLREQTSLAARLQRNSRIVLGLAIAVLWTTVLVRLLTS